MGMMHMVCVFVFATMLPNPFKFMCFYHLGTPISIFRYFLAPICQDSKNTSVNNTPWQTLLDFLFLLINIVVNSE